MLPIFALFNPALGMTTIVPEIDPRRPAAADPAKLVQAIRQEQVTNSFGSPTLWRNVAAHCQAHRITLPSLRRVLCAGAPVPAALWTAAKDFLPAGQLHSPYGATEALPVSTLSGAEEAEAEGTADRGACVGRPLPGIGVKSHRPARGPDRPSGATPPNFRSARSARSSSAGRSSPAPMTGCPPPRRRPRSRIRPPRPASGTGWATAAISTPPAGFGFAAARRSGCRRPAAPCSPSRASSVFRAHPEARRCALIGIGEPGAQTPALVVEGPARSRQAARVLAGELRALAALQPGDRGHRPLLLARALPGRRAPQCENPPPGARALGRAARAAAGPLKPEAHREPCRRASILRTPPPW